MALTKVSYSMITGICVNALDVGIVPNDNTKRASNTAALLAALNTANVYCLEFPPNFDTYYFNAFTLPSKVTMIRSFSTLRGDSGATLDIAQDPSTLVCIDTVNGAPQLSRFSRLQGLILSVPLTAKAVRIRNGGLMMDNIWIKQCDEGIQIIDSYGASYTNIGISAVTIALHLGPNGFVAANDFTQFVLNNACGPTASPNGGTTNGIGLFIDGSSSNVATVNTFQDFDCSSCGWGVKISGVSRDNTFIDYYAENNQQKNIEYIYPGASGVSQTDHWQNHYYGGGTYTPTADVFPTYNASSDLAVTRIDYGVYYGRQMQVPQIFFPNGPVSANAQVLDWYEEGTFTPVLDRLSGTPTITYTSQTGTFVRIGKMVTATATIVIDTVSTAGAGQNFVKSLPYASGVAADFSCGVVSNDTALTSNAKAGNMNGAGFYLVDTAGTVISESWVSGGTITFSVTYFAAS
jgi:hypothetical protein